MVIMPITGHVIYAVEGITVSRPERDDDKALLVFNNLPPANWVES